MDFKNPLDVGTLVELFSALMAIFMIISVPIVVFFLIYSGFLYVTARGNPEKIQVAKRSLLYGLIGGSIIAGAVAILEIMKNLVGEF
jgi:hypothetical protein